MDWKKEIKLSDLVKRRERPQPEAEGGKTSFLKREISLSRRPKAERAPEDDAVPFWKREVTLGRRRDAPAAADAVAAPAVEPRPPRDPQADRAAPVDAAAEPAFRPAYLPDPAPPTDASGYGWLTEPLEPADESPTWADLLAAAGAEVPDPEPVVPAAVAPPEAPPAVPPPAEAEPEPGPVGAPTARPGFPAPLPGVHPPVPAAQLPPLPETSARKASLLRRELSFRRRPKPERAPEGDRVPFWRRELTVGRRPQAVARAAAPKPRRGLSLPRPSFERGGHRAKKIVGLKVGASQVAAARVANNGSAQLLQLARRPIEPGIVVGGELRDPDALAEVLRAFFKEHKLPRRGVRLGIATNRIGVRSFALEDAGDAKQLQNAIRFRAQEALPIPVEEAVLDYQLLGESENEEGAKMRRVLLVVAYRELVDRYVEACRKAGIRLVGIDLEAFALLRALGAPPEEGVPAEAATVAVAIGYDRSTFAVSDGRVCEFTRVLEWGGFAINVAIARALDIAPSEAEPIKRALTLAGSEVPEGLAAERAEAAREAMRRQVGSFARELVSSLQFYQSQPDSLGIAGVTITGGTAHLEGLAEELERLIGVPVRVGDPLARVRLGRKVGDDDQVGSLAIAIGLGIED